MHKNARIAIELKLQLPYFSEIFSSIKSNFMNASENSKYGFENILDR